MQVSLSYFPVPATSAAVSAAKPSAALTLPLVDILSLQAIAAATAAALHPPTPSTPFTPHTVVAWALIPAYWALDMRYAAMHHLPGGASFPSYLVHRGCLMVLARLLFGGVPALVAARGGDAQQVAALVLYLPLLAVQCFVSDTWAVGGQGREAMRGGPGAVPAAAGGPVLCT